MPTVNALALNLLLEQGEETDDAGLVSLTERRVLEALDEIAVATNWNSFKATSVFDTVAAAATYVLPVGAREIIQLRYTDNGTPINMWTVQEAARRATLLEQPGRARWWLENGTPVSGANVQYQITLYPVPDSILEIEAHYYFHPSAVASGSTLPVQNQYIVPVKDRVRAAMLENMQKYDAADRAQRRFEKNLDSLIKAELGKVSAITVLQPTDISRVRRRPRPILPPDHYNNGGF